MQRQEIYKLIDSAIKYQWALVIKYCKYNGEISVRKISDIHYSGEYGKNYIDAFCYKRHERRTFKIDRILNMEKADENHILTNVPTKKSEGCYIATMAYGDYNHPQVILLRQYRDNVLKNTILGRFFIFTYYQISPLLVKMLKNNITVNAFIRKELDQFISKKIHL